VEQPKPLLSTATEPQAPNIRSDAPTPEKPSLATILKIFLLAGGLSFGGGAVAYLREYLVRKEHWMTDDQFLDGMEVSETLPGLNAVNMSVIVGDDLRGIPGATLAVIGMLLPGAITVMILGIVWESNRQNPYVTRVLAGIAAAAVGLLLSVTIQLGKRQVSQLPDIAIVIVTFLAVSLFKLSLPLVLFTIGPVAILLYRPHPSRPHLGESLPFHRGPHHEKHRH
jgi:chromate transporter